MTAAEVVEFEQGRWQHAGLKERAIRDRFGITPVRYYQHLNQIIDSGAFMELDPVLVGRLRRLRERASNQRGR